MVKKKKPKLFFIRGKRKKQYGETQEKKNPKKNNPDGRKNQKEKLPTKIPGARYFPYIFDLKLHKTSKVEKRALKQPSLSLGVFFYISPPRPAFLLNYR